MNLRSIPAAILAAVLFAGPALAGPPSVQLVGADRKIEPTSTFEIRFNDLMIPPEQVGQIATQPPVIFRPALKGTFTWLSQRSGTFKPTEPLALSSTYLLVLAPDVKKADGQALEAEFSASIQTPPVQLKGWTNERWIQTNDAPAEPSLALLFNVNFEPDVLARFAHFENAAHDTIAAQVVKADLKAQPGRNFPAYRSNDGQIATWTDRFYDMNPAIKRPDAAAVTSAGNHLWVKPAQPLTAGSDWQLIVGAGCPASDTGLRLLEPAVVKIGTVLPFAVSRADATNVINEGRQIEVVFSKNLAEEVTSKNLTRWMRLDPEPSGFKAEVSSRVVTFTGDFELDKDYRLVVDAGMPAAEPFVLATGFEKKLRFSQIPARVYFENVETHQLSTGSREYHLLAVNVPKVKVSARVFTAEAAPLALAAWTEYSNFERKRGDNYEEPHRKVDLSKMPGQTIWQQELEATTAVDEQQEVGLKWDEILGPGKTGMVLLTAEQVGDPAKPNARPGVQTVVQVTDLGVVWKQSKGETFTYVFSLATGQAIAGAKVRALGAANKVLDETTTDATGVARLKTTDDAQWIVAENGSDLHLVAFRDYRESLSLRHLGIQRHDFEEDEEAAENSRQALVFSERTVYKPGDTVHLKGILRDWRQGQPHLPVGAKATLKAVDPKERTFLTRAVTISEAGSFTEDIKLPTNPLGTYSIELKLAEDGPDAPALTTYEFEVQEFEPNAFEIKIAPAPRTVGEMKLELPITANYYMGKTLSQAQLSWSIEAGDTGFAPAGFGSFTFCNAVNDEEINEKLDRLSHFTQDGKLELDEKGATKIATTIPLNTRAPQPRSAHLLCEVTDIDQQTVSQAADFTVHSSDFYLGLRRPKGVVRQGETVPVDIVAVRTDGTPTPEPVKATLRLTRVEWENHRVETAGNGSEIRHEAHFELVSKATVKTQPVKRVEGQLSVGGESTPLVAGKPGQYLLEAVSQDAEGRDVITSTSFSVYGEGETEWDYDNKYQIDLVADREEYRSGQIAKILVKTPISGEALVTIEREKVLRSFVTQLSGNAPAIEVPLEGLDAPNVYVSVMLLRGASDSPRKIKAPEYRVGYCKLKVARADAKLSVYLEPNAPAVRPGDEVTIRGQVLDFEGHFIQNAEVTLYAVDEGVLSLTGYETPDPLTFFNQERWLSVTTGLTLPTLLSEDPENRSFENKGYLVGGGGEDASEAMRKNFVACAFWNGKLQTDAEGRIAAKFTAPDSLTRYRVIAVVQTAKDQFGSGESSFEVNKPVMLEPALPRFANVGDKIVLRGVLHNTTDIDGEVAVEVKLDGTATAAETTRKVMLPAHGSLAVDFPVEFKAVGEAVWKWSAKFAGGGQTYHDAVQTTLSVGYPVPLLRELRTSQTRDAEASLLVGFNPQLFEGTGTVRVSVTNSRILELRESLNQVLHYPYGCVEQTTSSTLPWISMRDFQRALPMLNKTDEEIKAAVNHGVDRLLSMQVSSGGLSYWPGGTEALFWGSAYGGFGLAMARHEGFEVPEEPFNRLCKYLSEQLRGAGDDSYDQHYRSGGPSDRCLALYALALAGKPEPAYHELLFKQRDKIGAENRALLALAIAESGGPVEMVKTLLETKADAVAPEYDWFWSNSRESALRLLAWCKAKPDAPQVGQLVSDLMGRRTLGHWITTQGNCWSLLALGEYIRHGGLGDVKLDGFVSWDRAAQPYAVNEETPLSTLEFPIDSALSAKPMKLSNPQAKQVFTEVLVEARPKSLQQPRQDQGYAIRRSYSKVEDDGTIGEAKDLHVGDRVLITLNLEVRQPARYLAVDDPLPAVFEALNPAFKSQETRAGETLGRAWTGDFQELREDRALFFADYITPGDYTIRYLARVRAAGTATAPAAKVEEMYHPERFGLTETMQMTSAPLK